MSEQSDIINKMLQEKYKINDLMVNGEALVTEEIRTVSVSPKLNIILSGGIPEGCSVILAGKPKCGKTTLALHYAAKCQRPEYGNREVFYLDIEHRLKTMNLRGIPGLDLKRFHVIHSTAKKIMSAQDFLKAAEDIITNVYNAVVIIDSYSMLTHANELASDIGTPVLGMGSYQLLSQFCRQMAQIIPVMKSNIVGITHMMANIGAIGHAAKTVEKGGNAIVYQGDVKLRAKIVRPWKVGSEETGKQIGQIVTWVCDFSALGAPGQEIDSYIRYGRGIDELYEIISCAMDIGLITHKGAWYTFDCLPDKPKAQGGEGLYRYLNENPDKRAEIEKSVLKVINP